MTPGLFFLLQIPRKCNKCNTTVTPRTPKNRGNKPFLQAVVTVTHFMGLTFLRIVEI